MKNLPPQHSHLMLTLAMSLCRSCHFLEVSDLLLFAKNCLGCCKCCCCFFWLVG